MKITKILAGAVGVAATVALSAQAGLTYNFNDGTMDGWQNTMVSSAAAGYIDAAFGPAQTYGRDGWGGGANADSHADGYTTMGGNPILDGNTVGAYFLAVTPYAATKGTTDWASWPAPGSGVHQSLMVESPAFTLDGSGSLSYIGAGGNGAGGALLNNVSQVPAIAGTWGAGSGNDPATAGAAQVSLMREDGTFVLTKAFDQGNWSTYTMSQSDLAPFVNDGHYYRLVMVDFLAGQSADYAIDNVQIPGVLGVPEPSTFALLGLGGLALMFRKRK